jgi:SNF2 family DNA or RNA helicase
MAQMVQTLSIYPDQPYDQPDVIDPATEDIIMSPKSLDKNAHRNKEDKLMELVKEKLEAGEKVLVYYHWTNRTDVAARLVKRMNDEGVNVAHLTAKVKAKDREAWINDKVEKGAQVLLCNPTLVQTGLDLLEFTTIVYYQMGYNLFTMRQASRRSWRLGQEHDIEVYFMYYKDTVQEKTLSLMASKLQAAMAIEGKFSEEGLNAMSNNEDLLTQIAASVTEGMKDTVDAKVFEQTAVASRKSEVVKIETTMAEQMKGYKHLDYKKLYLNSKRRGKRLLTANHVTTKIQNDPLVLLRMA